MLTPDQERLTFSIIKGEAGGGGASGPAELFPWAVVASPGSRSELSELLPVRPTLEIWESAEEGKKKKGCSGAENELIDVEVLLLLSTVYSSHANGRDFHRWEGVGGVSPFRLGLRVRNRSMRASSRGGSDRRPSDVTGGKTRGQ